MFAGVIESLLKKAKPEKPKVPPKDGFLKKVKDMSILPKHSHKKKPQGG